MYFNRKVSKVISKYAKLKNWCINFALLAKKLGPLCACLPAGLMDFDFFNNSFIKPAYQIFEISRIIYTS
jgi:hypothetical protein